MEQPIKPVVIFKKICHFCRKPFESAVRHQKFCPGSDCGEKAQKLKKGRRAKYQKEAEVLRVKIMAHQLAQRVVEIEILKGIRKPGCEAPGCEAKEKLEVHHKDFCWLNNCSTNLLNLCCHHHDEAHSLFKKGEATPFIQAAALPFQWVEEAVNASK